MKSNYKRILPAYAYLPIILVICTNFLAFYGTRIFSAGLVHYDFSLPVDTRIPFVPAFISVYIFAYIQWIISYILIARESQPLCYRLLSGELIAKVLCLIIFLVFPTTMARPEVTGTDIWSRLVRLIYDLDTPDNLFPSIHVLESWLCFRAALQLKKPGRWYSWASLIVTLFVIASVLLVKQHLAVDIVGGIAVMEIGQLIAKKTNAGRLLERLQARLVRTPVDAGEVQ